MSYINALIEIKLLEGIYSDKNKLPNILKEFISIGEAMGITIDVVYGVNTRKEGEETNTYAGFYITNEPAKKRIFIEDFIVENSIDGSAEYESGINWFMHSLKHQLN